MKVQTGIVTVLALILSMACNNDDNSGEILNEEWAEEIEDNPLQAEAVTENVIIAGGTEVDGALPTPNGAISLNVSGGSTAFLNEGFQLDLDSDSDITGAYLQFIENDGTRANSYFNIDLAANQTGKTTRKSRRQKSKKQKNSLDIDFGSQIEPGTFCYEICVYDSLGNISAPTEICVTVQSWGGNDALIGNWKFTKFEQTGEIEIYNIETGVANCEESKQTCEDGGSIDVSECYTINSADLDINSDGTYTMETKDHDRYLDYSESTKACEAIYEEEDGLYISEGMWAYDHDTDRLTLIEYKYVEDENSGINEPGDADIPLQGIVQLNGNTMVTTYIFEDEYNEQYTEITYFEK